MNRTHGFSCIMNSLVQTGLLSFEQICLDVSTMNLKRNFWDTTHWFLGMMRYYVGFCVYELNMRSGLRPSSRPVFKMDDRLQDGVSTAFLTLVPTFLPLDTHLIFNDGHQSWSLQSCPTLCDPIDSSPPGSAIPGILQASTLEEEMSYEGASRWQPSANQEKEASSETNSVAPGTRTSSLQYGLEITGTSNYSLWDFTYSLKPV
ncbi:uncharacterized protein LOC129621202 [Bubalus kerabau]|uniref:uncharacterized protein LOC129621202 n=1 Tax=Bubalus carabanensis TaxID=3119969 RepID=UPI00244E5ED0|nr:uncharacterized protein LOC129621202 [Bubalus carabanensis]